MSLLESPKVPLNPMTRPELLAFCLLAALVTGCKNGDQVKAADNPVKQAPARKIVVKTITEGSGEPLLEGDLVAVNYVARAADTEKVLDTNFETNDGKEVPKAPPYTYLLGLGEVIEGLEEGTIGVKPGEVREIFIPWEKAYGVGGQSAIGIGSKQDIKFTISVCGSVRGGEEDVFETNDTKPGSGPGVKSGDTITVHYKGTYANGLRFDNSRERGDIKAGGTPLTFKVGYGWVIQGMDVGVLGMKKGGVRIIKVPPLLAFGESGLGAIKGGHPLVFEVELLAIK